MSWLSNFNPLESIRQLKVDEHRLAIWKKRARWLLLLIALLFVAAHLLTRFYIWPQVEKNKASFEQAISQTLGVNLKIENIEDPKPKKDEVIVTNKAIGINFF